MKTIIDEIRKAKKTYIEQYESEPNTILINEKDLLKVSELVHYLEFGKVEVVYPNMIMGLKVIPIKYGKMQVVEVIE